MVSSRIPPKKVPRKISTSSLRITVPSTPTLDSPRKRADSYSVSSPINPIPDFTRLHLNSNIQCKVSVIIRVRPLSNDDSITSSIVPSLISSPDIDNLSLSSEPLTAPSLFRTSSHASHSSLNTNYSNNSHLHDSNSQSHSYPSSLANTPCWEIHNNTIRNRDAGNFTFDHVFDSDAQTDYIYELSIEKVIKAVLDGYNATIFAYGMTGSGKTFSMQGTNDCPGIIPRAVQSLFTYKNPNTNSSPALTVSYLEIYNEQIFDLLSSKKNNLTEDVKLQEVSGKGVRAVNLSRHSVQTIQDMHNLIKKGDQVRRTEGTDFNSRSSRSHAILSISVNNAGRLSTLYLCDLAGSEKATSQASRRKEGAYINKSLLTLGTVVSKLASAAAYSSSHSNSSSSSSSSSIASSPALGGLASPKHIPFRDSKLTRLLQPALSGKSIVTILCTIQNSRGVYNETLNTLRFASRAKNIPVSATRSDSMEIDSSQKIIENLKAQIEKQKIELEKYSNSTNTNNNNTDNNNINTSTNSNYHTKTNHNDELDEYKTNRLEIENASLREQIYHYDTLLNSKKRAKNLHSTQLEDLTIESFRQLVDQQAIELMSYRQYVSSLENMRETWAALISKTLMDKRSQDNDNNSYPFNKPPSPLSQYEMNNSNARKDAQGSEVNSESESRLLKLTEIITRQQREISLLKRQLSSRETMLTSLQRNAVRSARRRQTLADCNNSHNSDPYCSSPTTSNFSSTSVPGSPMQNISGARQIYSRRPSHVNYSETGSTRSKHSNDHSPNSIKSHNSSNVGEKSFLDEAVQSTVGKISMNGAKARIGRSHNDFTPLQTVDVNNLNSEANFF